MTPVIRERNLSRFIKYPHSQRGLFITFRSIGEVVEYVGVISPPYDTGSAYLSNLVWAKSPFEERSDQLSETQIVMVNIVSRGM